jgi:hypothetical protein
MDTQTQIAQQTLGNSILLRLAVLNANGDRMAFEVDGGQPVWTVTNGVNVASPIIQDLGQTCILTPIDPSKPASAMVTFAAAVKPIASVQFPNIPAMDAVPMTGQKQVQWLQPYQPASLVAVQG